VKLSFGIRGKSPICILTIRGGIGNQLFQIAALSYVARNLGYMPIVNDFDLSLSSRDKHQSQFRGLDLSEWFEMDNHLRLPESLTQKKFLQFLWKLTTRYRLFYTVSDKELASASNIIRDFVGKDFRIQDLKNCDLDGHKGLFFLNGSFQEPKYVLDLRPFNTQLLLKVNSEIFQDEIELNGDKVVIHVRLTDFTNDTDNYRQNIQAGLDMIGNRLRDFHCYTDDLHTTKNLLSQIQANSKVTFSFPDEVRDYDGVNLLRKLATYSNFIPSQSSICWWAFFLSQNHGLRPRVYAGGPEFAAFKFERKHD